MDKNLVGWLQYQPNLCRSVKSRSVSGIVGALWKEHPSLETIHEGPCFFNEPDRIKETKRKVSPQAHKNRKGTCFWGRNNDLCSLWRSAVGSFSVREKKGFSHESIVHIFCLMYATGRAGWLFVYWNDICFLCTFCRTMESQDINGYRDICWIGIIRENRLIFLGRRRVLVESSVKPNVQPIAVPSIPFFFLDQIF